MSVRSLSLLLAAALLLSWCFGQAFAATWRTAVGLSGQLDYTDNIFLTPDDEQGGLTFSITPSVSLTGTGKRLSLGFNYAPSYLQRFYSGGTSEFVHNLGATLSSELYKDVFFLDASANAGLTLVDPFGANPGDGINESDNTRQSFSLSISPSLVKHFGNYADMRIGYTYSRVWVDDSDDSPGHSANIDITSGSRFQIIDWSVSGSFSRTKYDDGEDSIFASVLGRVGYRVDRRVRINGYFGYDDNDFLRLADEVDETVSDNGAIYGAGATWTPTSRTTLDFAVAHRYFGTNLYFNFNHRHKRSVWTASLTHDPYNARSELAERQTFDTTDPFGDPIQDPAGEPVFIDPDSPLLTTSDYVRRQFQVGYNHSLKRGDFGMNGYYTERDYLDDELDTTGYGLSASLSHRLGTHLGSSLGANWSRNDQDQDDSSSKTWSIRAGLTHQLGTRTNLSFNLQHRRSYGDDEQQEYTENRATLTLGTSW